MNPPGFEDLARLPLVAYYEKAFRNATGVTLKLTPPLLSGPRNFGPNENPFCSIAASTPAGCESCQEAERRALHAASRHQGLQQVHCYAGMTVVASPVNICGKHVATLLCGQILRREATERDFLLVMKMIGKDQTAEWVEKARKAYFQTPLLNAERFQAVTELLSVYTQHLAELGPRLVLSTRRVEPKAVTAAKEFVRQHVEEAITLDEVVQHVHVSRFYFCKLFKKATGLTLTEYVARVRVERAKALLEDPSQRISEIVFAAGFGSIPQFNSVFKRQVGIAPSRYRAGLRPS